MEIVYLSFSNVRWIVMLFLILFLFFSVDTCFSVSLCVFVVCWL